jgi:hypothetical protein
MCEQRRATSAPGLGDLGYEGGAPWVGSRCRGFPLVQSRPPDASNEANRQQGSCGLSEGPKEKRNSQQCHEFRLRGSGRSRTDDDGFAIRCLSHLATEPTDQESAIGAWRLSFPRGRFRNTGLMPTSGNRCLTSRIVVTECKAVNNQRSQF